MTAGHNGPVQKPAFEMHWPLSQRINSFRSFAGTALFVTISKGLVVSSETGSKSFNMSHWSE